MRVVIKEDYEEACEFVAEYIAKRITEFHPDAQKPFVLGLPTGSTPLGIYKRLIEKYRAGELSFQYVVTFNMDEYVGLPPEHPESYHYFMMENFFNHIDIKRENIHILNGMAKDLDAECRAYELLATERLICFWAELVRMGILHSMSLRHRCRHERDIVSWR